MKTKKYLIPSFLLVSALSFGLFGNSVLPAQAAVKKAVVKKAVVKKAVVAKVSVVWAASGKKELARIPNPTVRAAYKAKVEKYAIRKKIKTITGSVVKGMHE